ncbi:Bug family tripartite tricarboxylate transporter substrate binding protein [Azospirillum soli]|uniref:Bug family tripartite tricarboxylate transporter substrate binding protein n=1 Tax=Azospirillum soli TaxID=1304799 RepID=UPI001AE9C4EE|nr:tripartite tricarboxylate transporter substrate binding protein [Azospirillum soli]MBP2312001.1 putative tricarboxylic transport membrane protein [Azospirillum soli]
MPQASRNPFALLWTVAVFAVGAAMMAPAPVRAQMTDLKIIAPAAPGGGWDQTARAMQEVMQGAGIARDIQVQNIAGAGGTIGLAQFVTGFKANPKALMVGGLVMVGAIQTNKSPVTLDQVTPIARLTGEYQAIVVPAQSEIRSLKELLERFKANPGSVSWGGGSAGGTDHIMVGLLAKEIGVDPRRVNYIPFSGGGEAMAALLGNHVTAGVSGWGEFAAQVQAGKLRALAISAPKRVPGIDVPTLREQAVNMELTNWRGVVAPPGLKPEAKQALAEAVEAMAKSPAWGTLLKNRQWMDLYQGPDDFAAFLKVDRARVETVLRDIGLVP